MLLEHERNYALVTVCSWNTNGIEVLGMDALVTVCSWNTNGNTLWALRALGTRTELWFGHGCSVHRVLLEHEQKYALGMDAWSPYALGTRTELWFGHGCSAHRMLWEHERNSGLGMEALFTVCSWNTNGINPIDQIR